MIKTFEDAVKFLEQYIPKPEKKFPGSLGFERMEYFVKLLGNPQLIYPTIHVGGTAGKGSTATIIASILSQRYKVGLYTSPHLVSICERIKVFQKIKNQKSKIKITNQKSKREEGMIAKRDFVDLVNGVYPAIRKMEKSTYGKPTHFEVMTAIAFLYFSEKKVDIAILEVGLGGRYDATNIIKPEIAVLTNVGLDHTEVLGDTVEKIAADKVGIIKQSISVVSGTKQSSVIEIISVKCRAQSAKLSLLNRDFQYKVKEISERGSTFDYFGSKTYKNLKLRLLGEYQVENAALAIRTIEQLSVISYQLSVNEIRNGLEKAFIPGRMEIVRRKPLIILDGAHNPEKMKALVSSISTIFPKRKIICILAIKKDKDARKMLEYLLPLCQKLLLTKFRLQTDVGDTYSYRPEELLEMARSIDKQKDTEVIVNTHEVVMRSIHEAKKDDFILITGSLYLIGEIKKFQISNYK